MAHGDGEVRLILSSRIELEYQAVKKWPLGRNVGHTGDQMFALKWPQVAGHRKGKEVNSKKGSFLSKARGRRTIAILLRAGDKKINWDMRDRSPSSQY